MGPAQVGRPLSVRTLRQITRHILANTLVLCARYTRCITLYTNQHDFVWKVFGKRSKNRQIILSVRIQFLEIASVTRTVLTVRLIRSLIRRF